MQEYTEPSKGKPPKKEQLLRIGELNEPELTQLKKSWPATPDGYSDLQEDSKNSGNDKYVGKYFIAQCF